MISSILMNSSGPVLQSLLKIKVTLNSKIRSFTKPPSLKETLKTALNFKGAKDLP